MAESPAFRLFKANVDRVLKERKKKGLLPGTRAELAKKLDVDASWVSRIFRKPGVNLETVERLATGLEVSPAALLVDPSESVIVDRLVDHSLDTCVARVSAAALRHGAGEEIPDGPPSRRPTMEEIVWVLKDVLEAGAEELLVSVLEKWRAKTAKKAAGSSDAE